MYLCVHDGSRDAVCIAALKIPKSSGPGAVNTRCAGANFRRWSYAKGRRVFGEVTVGCYACSRRRVGEGLSSLAEVSLLVVDVRSVRFR